MALFTGEIELGRRKRVYLPQEYAERGSHLDPRVGGCI
jgi:hypothetical protein